MQASADLKIFSILLLFLVLAIGLYGLFFLALPGATNNINVNSVTDAEIISILKGDKDIEGYISENPEFKISKEILSVEAIMAGQKGQNFKEVYYGLDLQDNRYMKVNLMNPAGDSGFIGVIDFKSQKTVKSFGVILLKAGAGAINKNGKATSQTADNKTP